MDRIQSTRLIYLDCFSLKFFFSNLKDCFKNEIIIIEELSSFNNLIIKILNFLGFRFKELNFVAGHLNYKNENVFLKAREIAGKLSIDCSSDIISSSETILNLNIEFNEGTIELFISRYLQLYVEKWIMNILVIQSINRLSNSESEIFLRKPYIFNEKLISNYFPDLNITFYSNNFSRNLKIYLLFISSKFSDIKFIFHAFKKKSKSTNNTEQKSVLCLQNDTISLDRKKRSQPHWVDSNNIANYNTYILSFGYKSSPNILDEKKLNQKNCYVVFPSVFLKSYKANKNNKVLKLIFATIKKTNLKFWLSNNYSEKYHLLQINKLFLKSYLVSAIAIDLKTKVFIINEPQSIYSDALVLVSDKLCIKTIALQYSNMTLISPLMMSNANVFCIFSEIYKDVFSYKNIKPDKYLVTGYLYNGLKDYLIEDSRKLKKYFENANVDFIISYFDENIQYGKWALYNDSDHIRDIECLANTVIKNNKLGIVIKTQFNYNSPAVLYPNNLLIKQAYETGRFIEIKSGSLRNDIYVAQAALASDLCIGHSYGATASLEAAVYGVSSVLIAENKISTRLDYLYNQSNIIYDSLESVLKNVLENKNNSIGDWSPIIGNFDSDRNFSAKNNLNKIVNNYLN